MKQTRARTQCSDLRGFSFQRFQLFPPSPDELQYINYTSRPCVNSFDGIIYSLSTVTWIYWKRRTSRRRHQQWCETRTAKEMKNAREESTLVVITMCVENIRAQIHLHICAQALIDIQIHTWTRPYIRVTYAYVLYIQYHLVDPYIIFPSKLGGFK